MFPHLLMRLTAPWILGATLGLGLATTASAISDTQFQQAFSRFVQASAGDSAAIDAAAQAFQDLVKIEPANPVLHAYAGSAIAMQAGNSWLPWKKMSLAEDGLAELDKALSLLSPAHEAPVQNGTPGVLEVKFVAANTFLAVPEFMHRRERGAKLLGEVLAHPLLASAPLGFRGSVWLKAAKEASKAQKPAEAKRYLNLIVQQQAPQAAQAQALLKGMAL